MASKRTKKAAAACIILGILHALCLLGPFLYYLPAAFIAGEIVEKISLGLTTILCIVLALISLVVDASHKAGLHKSIVWVLILAITLSFAHIRPFIYIMAGVSILDELILVPLKEHFRAIKITNKEIDKAMNR